ncbi:MAG TPA: hypothetical protein HA330_00415 [Candidatus Thalassarchaeaceae archaeon]|nr:MAG TPA: hypothetical protein D7H85_00415 [Candidatus Poseidoniales archaeon]HII48324.1 hypothetical protein [Candidatus Thalassarchaeaceae archaeon]
MPTTTVMAMFGVVTVTTMGSPEMTSVSVSFEIRRRLNSLKAMEGVRSVDDLLKAVLKEHRLNRLRSEQDSIRLRIRDLEKSDIEAVIARITEE